MFLYIVSRSCWIKRTELNKGPKSFWIYQQVLSFLTFTPLYFFDDPVVNFLTFTVVCMVAFSSENNDMIVICAYTFRMCGTYFNLTSWSRGIILDLALSVSSWGGGRIM